MRGALEGVVNNFHLHERTPEQMRAVGLGIYLFVLLLYVDGDFTPIPEGRNGVRSTDSSLQTLTGRLESLINSFTSVLSLDIDASLYKDTIRDFTSLLDDYFTLLPSCEESLRLVHAAILGVFQLQNGAVKDRLARVNEEINRNRTFELAHWSMDILKIILFHPKFNVTEDGINCSSSELWSGQQDGRTALELAVELRLLNVAELLIEISAFPLNDEIERFSNGLLCNVACLFQLAIRNRDVEMTLGLIKHLKKSTSKFGVLCGILNEVCDRTCGSDFSPFQVAYLHCILLSSCKALDILTAFVGRQCVPDVDSEAVKAILNHTEQHCPRVQHTPPSPFEKVNGNWVPGLTRRSGWAVYSDFHVGRKGCDLPTVQLDDLTETKFKYFQDLHVPFVIEGATKVWEAWDYWRKETLEVTWPDLDLLIGSIPYADVFGETSGYATVSETLAYMDSYSRQEALCHLADHNTHNWNKIQLPFYVFDGTVLEDNNLSFLYKLPVYFSRWPNSIPQFILGPAGSGAPFHFHCPAVNALIYGRKKWFLYPPSRGVYSKEHPLTWYSRQYAHKVNETQPVECVQQSGQLLYVPSGWSHATINLDEAIGLAVEFGHSNC